jgi:hypothetical protein
VSRSKKVDMRVVGRGAVLLAHITMQADAMFRRTHTKEGYRMKIMLQWGGSADVEVLKERVVFEDLFIVV